MEPSMFSLGDEDATAVTSYHVKAEQNLEEESNSDSDSDKDYEVINRFEMWPSSKATGQHLTIERMDYLGKQISRLRKVFIASKDRKVRDDVLEMKKHDNWDFGEDSFFDADASLSERFHMEEVLAKCSRFKEDDCHIVEMLGPGHEAELLKSSQRILAYFRHKTQMAGLRYQAISSDPDAGDLPSRRGGDRRKATTDTFTGGLSDGDSSGENEPQPELKRSIGQRMSVEGSASPQNLTRGKSIMLAVSALIPPGSAGSEAGRSRLHLPPTSARRNMRRLSNVKHSVSAANSRRPSAINATDASSADDEHPKPQKPSKKKATRLTRQSTRNIDVPDGSTYDQGKSASSTKKGPKRKQKPIAKELPPIISVSHERKGAG